MNLPCQGLYEILSQRRQFLKVLLASLPGNLKRFGQSDYAGNILGSGAAFLFV